MDGVANMLIWHQIRTPKGGLCKRIRLVGWFEILGDLQGGICISFNISSSTAEQQSLHGDYDMMVDFSF